MPHASPATQNVPLIEEVIDTDAAIPGKKPPVSPSPGTPETKGTSAGSQGSEAPVRNASLRPEDPMVPVVAKEEALRSNNQESLQAKATPLASVEPAVDLAGTEPKPKPPREEGPVQLQREEPPQREKDRAIGALIPEEFESVPRPEIVRAARGGGKKFGFMYSRATSPRIASIAKPTSPRPYQVARAFPVSLWEAFRSWGSRLFGGLSEGERHASRQ